MGSRRSWSTVALLTAGAALAVAVGLGVAHAGSPGANGPPNSVGHAAHPRPLEATPLAASSLSATVRDALATAGGTSVGSVASVGSGRAAAELLSVTLPGGRSCLSVAHAGGTIVEPPNCADDSYLRVWSDMRGSGDPGTGPVTSQRMIAVVSAEVTVVRLSFADGSTETLAPDARGVVMFEGSGGLARLIRVEALAADGSSLGSASV